MSLITDACNNIAHDCKDRKMKRNTFYIKGAGIKNIESQIQENRNEMDIISGSYVDDTKLRGNGYVYVVDIPYVGQVSWHTDRDTSDKLEEMNIDPYPYKLEKEGRFVSEILMNNAKMDRKNMPHNYLIQMLPCGEENNLRAALDYYERNKRKIYDEKSRLQIVKELVDERNFSPEMAENLKTVLEISDSEFSKAKKSYIEKNEVIIQGFTNAIYKGEKYVKEHTAKDIAEAIKDFFPDTDLAMLETSLRCYQDHVKNKYQKILENSLKTMTLKKKNIN